MVLLIAHLANVAGCQQIHRVAAGNIFVLRGEISSRGSERRRWRTMSTRALSCSHVRWNSPGVALGRIEAWRAGLCIRELSGLSEVLRRHLGEVDDGPVVAVVKEEVLAGQLPLALQEATLTHYSLNLGGYGNAVGGGMILGRCARVVHDPK